MVTNQKHQIGHYVPQSPVFSLKRGRFIAPSFPSGHRTRRNCVRLHPRHTGLLPVAERIAHTHNGQIG